MATIKPVVPGRAGNWAVLHQLQQDRFVTRLASAMARLKKNLMGPSRSSPTLTSRDATIDQETIMKISAIALAAAFALSGTAAFANTVHHKVAVTTDRAATGMVQLHPNDGNPNGNPDGPTTLSGTGARRSVARRPAPAATTNCSGRIAVGKRWKAEIASARSGCRSNGRYGNSRDV